MFKSIKPSSKNLIFYSIFFIIITAAFLVRVWDLGKNPAGFFCDEASIGYNAYSILKTGKDEWGIKLPIFFKAFGEYKNPLDIYFTIPFVAIFGLNEFAVRFTSVFFSLLSLVLVFFIGKKMKDKVSGLILMFILAINPWHIHLSRINLEGFQILLFLLLISIFFLLRFYKHNKAVDLVLFSLFSSLASYSYFPARIIMPLFFIVIIFSVLFKKIYFSPEVATAVLIYIVVSLPLIFHLTLPQGLNRWQQVSVFNQKKINPIKKIATSYLLHFSPDFLFLKGDIDMPGQDVTRHSIRGIGEFYLWQLPFIILGAYYLIIKKSKFSLPIFLLLILYPLPSSLTINVSPQATRSITGIVPFTFLTAFGVDCFLYQLNKINHSIRLIVLFLLSFVVVFSFVNFVHLLKKYPLYSSDSWGWQYGPKETMNYFLSKKDNYDEFYMAVSFNGPKIFLKFYDPDNLCQNKCKMGDLLLTPEIYTSSKRQLFSLSPTRLKKLKFKDKFKIKKTIYYPNGKEAFLIGELY